MASITIEITINSSTWTQIGVVAEQVLITPRTPNKLIMVRYASSQPASTVLSGHKFFAKDDSPSAIAGSANTDNIWARLLSGDDLILEVTAL